MTPANCCRRCGSGLPDDGKRPYGPFCSAKCQDADLFHWFREDYKISREVTEEDLTDPALATEAQRLRERFGVLDPYDPRFS